MLDDILATSEKTLDGVAADIVATECFDDDYDIYSTSDYGDGPLALVAMHPAENLSLVDPFYKYLDRFKAADVYKYTGIDFLKFLDLPRDRAEAMLDKLDNLARKESTEVNNLLNGAMSGKR